MEEQNFPNIFEEDLGQNIPKPPGHKKLERSKTDSIVTGLCSGIAKYLNTEAAIIRIIVILSLLFGIWSIVVYIIASLLVPLEKDLVELTSVEKEFQRKINFRTVISGLMILSGVLWGFYLLGFLSFTRMLILPNTFIWSIISLALGAYTLSHQARDRHLSQPMTPDRYFRSRSDRRILGVCGGFGKYLAFDSSSIRLIIMLGTFLTLGGLAIAYLLFGLLTKLEKDIIETPQ